jgi:hypothetical protein
MWRPQRNLAVMAKRWRDDPTPSAARLVLAEKCSMPNLFNLEPTPYCHKGVIGKSAQWRERAPAVWRCFGRGAAPHGRRICEKIAIK